MWLIAQTELIFTPDVMSKLITTSGALCLVFYFFLRFLPDLEKSHRAEREEARQNLFKYLADRDVQIHQDLMEISSDIKGLRKDVQSKNHE